jgi:MSHA biogenesis protein MshK
MSARALMPVSVGGALAALFVAMPSGAQALSDPTQPPSFSGLPAESPAAPGGPALQSILVGPGRRHAVIDGRQVKVGDRVGDARIVAIDFDAVRLREGTTTRVMKLIPDIQKSAAKISTTGADPQGDSKGRGR